MRTLLRLVLGVGVLTALGVSLAMTYSDSEVDFTNPDITTLYVSLDSSGPAGLEVLLSSAPVEGYVSTIDVSDKLNDYEAIASDIFSSGDITKYLGNGNWAAAAFPDEVELSSRSAAYGLIRLKQNQAFPAVTDAYLSRLEALGYSLSETSVTSNITVYTAAKGDESLRLVFVRASGSTWVTLSTQL